MPSSNAIETMIREIARGAKLIDLCNERQRYTPAEFFRDLDAHPQLAAKYEVALRCRCEVELETAQARIDAMLDGSQSATLAQTKLAQVALMHARWLAERLLPDRFAVQTKRAGPKPREAEGGDAKLGDALEAAMKRIEERKRAELLAKPTQLRAVPARSQP